MITLRMDDDSAKHLAAVLHSVSAEVNNAHDTMILKGVAESIRMALNHAPIGKGITASYSSE